MSPHCHKNISECQDELYKQGYFITKIELPRKLTLEVQKENYNNIDHIIGQLLKPRESLFEFLKLFCDVKSIEHIISLREAKNSWEEDGIWHDDGSRILAFSLSLTLKAPKGGVLEFRKKGELPSQKIPTPNYGNIIVFKTGHQGFEHKINQVLEGKRLIIAGWCYPTKEY